MKPNAEDLKITVQEIEKFLKVTGFVIFYGTDINEGYDITEVEWNKEKSDWRDFLSTAKKAEAKVIVLQASPFSIERFIEMLDEENEEGGKPTKLPKDLEGHIGLFGQFSLFWFRDGVKYSYSQATDWWKQVERLCEVSESSEDDKDISSEDEKAVIKEIEAKSIEELADELVIFIEKEFPNQKISGERMRFFWKSKGLDYSLFLDVSVENKMDKVRSLAKLKLEQKENNIIPEFIEYCLQWSKNKGLKRISRVDIDYLLRKKGLTLSKPSRETVYNELKNLFENMLKEKDQGS